MFEALVRINGRSRSRPLRWLAGNLLEKLYGCEIRCDDIDPSVRFAHHGRGCTIVAARLSANVVIFQNVTLGTNMKYDKRARQWENVGNPVIAENVVICDGAKVLGPVIVGSNSVVAAGAIVTRDVPAGTLVTGVNRHAAKDPDYDLVFNPDMIAPEQLMRANRALIERYKQNPGN